VLSVQHPAAIRFFVFFGVEFDREMSGIVVSITLPVNEIARKFSGTFGLALLVLLERSVPTWRGDSNLLLNMENKIQFFLRLCKIAK
jgi:hypothetical protein